MRFSCDGDASDGCDDFFESFRTFPIALKTVQPGRPRSPLWELSGGADWLVPYAGSIVRQTTWKSNVTTPEQHQQSEIIAKNPVAQSRQDGASHDDAAHCGGAEPATAFPVERNRSSERNSCHRTIPRRASNRKAHIAWPNSRSLEVESIRSQFGATSLWLTSVHTSTTAKERTRMSLRASSLV